MHSTYGPAQPPPPPQGKVYNLLPRQQPTTIEERCEQHFWLLPRYLLSVLVSVVAFMVYAGSPTQQTFLLERGRARLGHSKPGYEVSLYLYSFYWSFTNIQTSICPQAVLVDMEEGVVGEMLRGPLGEVFDHQQLITGVSGSGNNWLENLH